MSGKLFILPDATCFHIPETSSGKNVKYWIGRIHMRLQRCLW